MSSTSIGPELHKNENEIKKPEVKIFEEEQDSVLEQPKMVMTLKKINHLSPQRNIKLIKMAHQPPQQLLTKFTRKINQGKIWLRKPTHLLSPQK